MWKLRLEPRTLFKKYINGIFVAVWKDGKEPLNRKKVISTVQCTRQMYIVQCGYLK